MFRSQMSVGREQKRFHGKMIADQVCAAFVQIAISDLNDRLGDQPVVTIVGSKNWIVC